MLKINNVYIAIYIYSNKTTQIIYTFISLIIILLFDYINLDKLKLKNK